MAEKDPSVGHFVIFYTSPSFKTTDVLLTGGDPDYEDDELPLISSSNNG